MRLSRSSSDLSAMGATKPSPAMMPDGASPGVVAMAVASVETGVVAKVREAKVIGRSQ